MQKEKMLKFKDSVIYPDCGSIHPPQVGYFCICPDSNNQLTRSKARDDVVICPDPFSK